jgi:hypothetical protein
MGKVVAKIRLTNYLDLELQRLKLRREKPRAVQTDALVDTGATRLYLRSTDFFSRESPATHPAAR